MGLCASRNRRSPTSAWPPSPLSRAKLETEEEKDVFRRLLKGAAGVYMFQEDHGFYIDQGSTACLRIAVIACGKRLYRRGLLKSIDDVCWLTFDELREVMDMLCLNEKAAVYHYMALVPALWRSARKTPTSRARPTRRSPSARCRTRYKTRSPSRCSASRTSFCIPRAKKWWPKDSKASQVLPVS